MGNTVEPSLRGVEYTRRWYRSFLDQLLSDGYRFRSFDDQPVAGDVLLRHDVDLSVEAALEMARVEADLGVESTYFLLLTSPLYNVFERDTREQIEAIVALGHDVGVHFSTHAYWPTERPPSDADLVEAVRHEQAALGTIVPPVETVSFHIPPPWVLDRAFHGIRSTYEPALFTDIDYVADSTGRWRDRHPLDGELGEVIQVLTHPGLWGETDAGFIERVEGAVTDACRHTRTRTHAEFLSGGDTA